MGDAARRFPRVFFYVQHLLGVGHLVRAARIAKALSAAGFPVLFVTGGEALPALAWGGAERFALPPVRAGAEGFGSLVHPDGRAFDAAAQESRRDLLCRRFDAFAPDILIVEAFPFGRRQMRFELIPLLDRAKARATPPLIAASIRDILQEDRRPERSAETRAYLDRFFDLVLVHGDPRLVALPASYPDAATFAAKLAYTGIVAPKPVAEPITNYAVVVSAGGGAVGAALLEAALLARPTTRLAQAPWLVLTGPNMPEAARQRLTGLVAPGVTLQAYRPDLAQVLAGAQLSVSQAGYNTVADLLVARCRAVLVPYAAGGETEQTTRARRLDDLGYAASLSEVDLGPATLAAAIDRALALAPPDADIDLDGAAGTARILAARFGFAGL